MPGKLLKTTRVLPLARLLTAAQIVMLARRHWLRLEPDERRRLISLVAQGRGRKRNLSIRDQAELARLVAKADPRLFIGVLAQRFSPVPLPGRVVRGPRRR